MTLLKCILSVLFTASRIRYEITSGNIGGAFAVKNMTGAIYVAGALDYETRKRVSLAYYLIFIYPPFVYSNVSCPKYGFNMQKGFNLIIILN